MSLNLLHAPYEMGEGAGRRDPSDGFDLLEQEFFDTAQAKTDAEGDDDVEESDHRPGVEMKDLIQAVARRESRNSGIFRY